jgi:hypothetical protein
MMLALMPCFMHDDEADQHPHRQGKNAHQGAAEMKQKNDANDGHDHMLSSIRVFFRLSDGTQDQSRPVVDRLDVHPFGQAGLEFRQSPFLTLSITCRAFSP